MERNVPHGARRAPPRHHLMAPSSLRAVYVASTLVLALVAVVDSTVTNHDRVSGGHGPTPTRNNGHQRRIQAAGESPAEWCSYDDPRAGTGCGVCSDDPSAQGGSTMPLSANLASLSQDVFNLTVPLPHASAGPDGAQPVRAVFWSPCGLPRAVPVPGMDPSCAAASVGAESSACFCHAELGSQCASLGDVTTAEWFLYSSVNLGAWGQVEAYPSFGVRYTRPAGECDMGCDGGCTLTVYLVCDPEVNWNPAPSGRHGAYVVDVAHGLRAIIAPDQPTCNTEAACETCITVATDAVCAQATCLGRCADTGRPGVCDAGVCVCGGDMLEGVRCREPCVVDAGSAACAAWLEAENRREWTSLFRGNKLSKLGVTLVFTFLAVSIGLACCAWRVIRMRRKKAPRRSRDGGRRGGGSRAGAAALRGISTGDSSPSGGGDDSGRSRGAGQVPELVHVQAVQMAVR